MSSPAIAEAGTCWQFIVKQQQRRLLSGYEDQFSAADGCVERISMADAKSFVVQYEWLGNVGSAKYCYGLSFGSQLAAVVCYTSPSAPGAFKRLLGEGLRQDVLQLCRGASASWAPNWASSRLISASLRDLRTTRSTRAVIAFADPRAGEVGVVYQACNALYLGLTDSRGPGEYIILGKRYHARAVPKHFHSAKHAQLVEIDPNYTRIQRTKKHRYLFLLARGRVRLELYNRVAHLIRPYPRRLQVQS
jgi:hypothetical protein